MPRLEVTERRKLSKILSETYDFIEGGASGRRTFIQQTAGLGQFITGTFDLLASHGTVAKNLIGRVEEFGYLPDRPAYHSLGALLDAMLSLNELTPENSKFIASLIVRYSLITDPTYLENLRDQYHLTEQVACEPPSENIPPQSRVGRIDSAPKFEAKIDREQVLESIINSADNFLDIHLLEGASYSAQAVAQIEIPEGTPYGTGFLVGPDLLLTCQHVLKDRSYLEEAVARFGFVKDASGVASKGKIVKMQPDFYHASSAQRLDYALVRLQEAPIKNLATAEELRKKSIAELLRMGKHRGYLVLAARMFLEHQRVNIIQHPNSEPLKAVLTQNYVVHKTDLRVQYIVDTMCGSSGSPIFNQRWEVVGLHHSNDPYPSESLSDSIKKALKGKFTVNEGIPMRVILEDFKKEGIDRFLLSE